MLPSIPMEPFFEDPNHLRLPPDQVRITDLKAEPFPDGHRVRIMLELTPFINRPDGEITIFDALGEAVAQANIIETMLPKIALTLHLRGGDAYGPFKVIAKIFYSQNIISHETGEFISTEYIEPTLVDQKEISFLLGTPDVNRKD
jgi:hypothetical protein